MVTKADNEIRTLENELKEFIQGVFGVAPRIEKVIITEDNDWDDDSNWTINVILDDPRRIDPKKRGSLVMGMYDKFGEERIKKFPVMYFRTPEDYEFVQNYNWIAESG